MKNGTLMTRIPSGTRIYADLFNNNMYRSKSILISNPGLQAGGLIRTGVIILAFLVPAILQAQGNGTRWSILKNGSIEWTVKPEDPHFDHIEMSGEKVSLWIR